jgi:predicted  nucleic acid-binding Zn-ribbon protein
VEKANIDALVLELNDLENEEKEEKAKLKAAEQHKQRCTTELDETESKLADIASNLKSLNDTIKSIGNEVELLQKALPVGNLSKHHFLSFFFQRSKCELIIIIIIIIVITFFCF